MLLGLCTQWREERDRVREGEWDLCANFQHVSTCRLTQIFRGDRAGEGPVCELVGGAQGGVKKHLWAAKMEKKIGKIGTQWGVFWSTRLKLGRDIQAGTSLFVCYHPSENTRGYFLKSSETVAYQWLFFPQMLLFWLQKKKKIVFITPSASFPTVWMCADQSVKRTNRLAKCWQARIDEPFVFSNVVSTAIFFDSQWKTILVWMTQFVIGNSMW